MTKWETLIKLGKVELGNWEIETAEYRIRKCGKEGISNDEAEDPDRVKYD